MAAVAWRNREPGAIIADTRAFLHGLCVREAMLLADSLDIGRVVLARAQGCCLRCRLTSQWGICSTSCCPTGSRACWELTEGTLMADPANRGRAYALMAEGIADSAA